MTETNPEALIRTLVTPLVKHREAVKVSLDDKGRYRHYYLSVAPSDVGRLIGRQGHVAASLRTIVEGSRDRHANTKKIRFRIKDYRH